MSNDVSVKLNQSKEENMSIILDGKKQGIPFAPSMNIPNKRLISALEEAEAIETGKIKAKRYKNFEDAFENLDNII